MTKFYKILIYTGHCSFLVLLVLSIIYYKERVVFIDTIFQFFKIVNFEKFNIEAGRFSTFVSQIPLLLAIKANVGLKSLMWIYSISFIILFYGIFVLCTHTLKNTVAGITIVFIFLLCIRQSFYHSSTETHQALLYSALLFALLYYPFKEKLGFIKYVLAALTIILAFYSHPVALFTVLFVIGYYIVDKLKWRETGVYLLIVIVLLLSITKLIFTPDNSYEGNFFSELLNFDFSFRNIYNAYSTHFFLKRVDGLYFWPVVFGLITFVFLLLKKDFIKVVYFSLAVTGFLLITIITYNKGDSDVMMERAFMPLSIFIIIPFLNGVVINIKNNVRTIAIMFIVTALISGIIRINREGQRYHQRYTFVEELVKKARENPGRKYLLKNTEEINSQILIPWPFAFTTMVISSLESKTSTLTIYICNNIDDFGQYLNGKPEKFLGAPFWIEWDISRLNSNYFNLPVSTYRVLE